MSDRCVRDGKVAVLVSPGYGAGWSTWCDSDHQEFFTMDSGLVALSENKASEGDVEQYVKTKLGPGVYAYYGGWDCVVVEWLEPGTRFCVEEYDGNEWLRFIEDLALTA